MLSRKPRIEFRKWVIYSAISAVWILHQMSAHEILVNYVPNMVEKQCLHAYGFLREAMLFWDERPFFWGP